MVTILGLKEGIPPLIAAHLQHWAYILSPYQYTIKSGRQKIMVMLLGCQGYLGMVTQGKNEMPKHMLLCWTNSSTSLYG